MTPQEFAAKIRAKHPGAYDNKSDEELSAAYVKKFPVYQKQLDPPRAPNAPPINPDFQKNLDASAPFDDVNDPIKQSTDKVGDLLKGVGNRIGDTWNAATHSGTGVLDLLSGPEPGKKFYEGMVNHGEENANWLENSLPEDATIRRPIVKTLGAIPILGDTMKSMKKGMSGDWEGAGEAGFDAVTAGAPSGLKALKALRGSSGLTTAAKGTLGPLERAGAAIRPAIDRSVPGLSKAAQGTSLAETAAGGAGFAFGSQVGHPYAGMSFGQQLAKRGKSSFDTARTKLADVMDPTGTTLEDRIARSKIPDVYEGEAIPMEYGESSPIPPEKAPFDYESVEPRGNNPHIDYSDPMQKTPDIYEGETIPLEHGKSYEGNQGGQAYEPIDTKYTDPDRKPLRIEPDEARRIDQPVETPPAMEQKMGNTDPNTSADPWNEIGLEPVTESKPGVALEPVTDAPTPKVVNWNMPDPQAAVKKGNAIITVNSEDIIRLAEEDINRPGRARQKVDKTDKLTRAKSYLAGSEKVDIPELSIKNGKLVIDDGYHRTQAAHDMGAKNIPITISLENLYKLKKLGLKFDDTFKTAKSLGL